ncbi:MAG: hypothetical protein EXX96DRAFT_546714 [Benjaminiella poitrasii]|nr:MAG: hypothetical protein EXX96DRAFT_546714 [Benjaminiella poitrasii]
MNNKQLPSALIENTNPYTINRIIHQYTLQKQSKFYKVFPLIKYNLEPNDLLTCALLNSSFNEIVSDIIWKEPNFDKFAYIHNSLYIFNKFLSRLHSLRKSTASKIIKIDLSKIEESLYDRVNPHFFKLLVQYCSEGLQLLDLSNAEYFTSRSLSFTQSMILPNVAYLNLSYCPNVNDDMLIEIARLCPQLKQVRLDGLIKHKGRGLAALAAKCEQLESVSVQDNTFLQDEAVVALAKLRHIRLIELDLKGCTKVTSVGFDFLARYAAHLKYLSLSQTSVKLEQLNNLACLNDYRHTVQSLDVSSIKHCSHQELAAWICNTFKPLSSVIKSCPFDTSLLNLTMDMDTVKALIDMSEKNKYRDLSTSNIKLPEVKCLTLVNLSDKINVNYLYKISTLFPDVNHLIFTRPYFEADDLLLESYSNDKPFSNEENEFITESILRQFNLKQNKVLATITHGTEHKKRYNFVQW